MNFEGYISYLFYMHYVDLDEGVGKGFQCSFSLLVLSNASSFYLMLFVKGRVVVCCWVVFFSLFLQDFIILCIL